MPIIRKVLTTSLRLVVTAGLVWALAARFDMDRAAHLIFQASPSLLLATVAVLFTANLIVGVRWHLILSAAVPSPGLATLLKVVLVGVFFNQLLPTGVGGDAVRVWRCNKLSIGLGAAIRSILLDRACGYLVLVVAYAAALPGLMRVLPELRERAAVLVVLVAALLGLLALVSFDQLPRKILHLRIIAPFGELSRESRRLFARPGLCSAVLGLSVVIFGLNIFAFKLDADAIGSSLPLRAWMMVVPPATLIQLLPVSLAGWGVREVVLVVALGSFGVPAEEALATSVLLGLCTILVGLPGGLVWLTDWDLARVGRSPAASPMRLKSGL
jgi:glycosyltransferase 2 family protein